jgi:2-hydroxymuconate-semialdehyde hydrolase
VKKVMATGTMGASFPCKPGSRLWRYPEGRDAVRQSAQVTVFDKALIDEAEVDYRWIVLSAPGYREYWESMFDKEKQHYIDAAAVPAEDLAKVKAQAQVLMMHGRQDVNFPPDDTCLVLARSLHADVWVIDNCAHSVALEHPQKFLAGAGLLFGTP